MFSIDNNNTSVFQTEDLKKIATQEKAIKQVEQLSQARLQYNKTWLDYLKPKAPTQILQIFANVFGLPVTDANAFFKDDIEFYSEILTLIKTTGDYQKLIDELYFSFKHEQSTQQPFQTTITLAKTSKNITASQRKAMIRDQKQNKRILLESNFRLEALSALLPLISTAEACFQREWKSVAVETPNGLQGGLENTDGLTVTESIVCKYIMTYRDIAFIVSRNKHLTLDKTPEYLECSKKMNEALPFICDTYPIMLRLLSTLYPQLENYSPNPDSNSTKSFYEKSKQLRINYFEIYNSYEKTQEFKQTLLALENESKPETFDVTPTEFNQTNTATNEEKTLTQQPETFSKINTETNNNADTTEEREKKFLAYHAEVKKKQQQKEQAKQEQKQRIVAQLVQRKIQQNKALTKKETSERESAFQMLFSLNPTHLALIENVFKKPTPHNQIRYHDIFSLFGKQSEGKIPGIITAGGGSHRKICIFMPAIDSHSNNNNTLENAENQTIGFFDEAYFEEQPTTNTSNNNNNSTVTGPLFKAHQQGHTGKLPSIAITMVCDTLAEAGITTENLQLFLDAKTAMAQTGQADYTWRALLAKALEIKNSQTTTSTNTPSATTKK
jgi:hypothetical protein